MITMLTLAMAGWPDPDVTPAGLEVPDAAGHPTRIFLIAGHGNGSRDGNVGVHGQLEAEVTLERSLGLGSDLEATGWFDVVQGRGPTERPSFARRKARLEASGAPLMVELHTDARGHAPRYWAVSPQWQYLARWDHGPGFTVLYNEGSPLGPERRRLAEAIATAMTEAGFHPYTQGYGDLYDFGAVPGTYIDRRQLFMLRRPLVPSVIIEMHNAIDYYETLRWREPAVHDAFGSAVACGLLDYLDLGDCSPR